MDGVRTTCSASKQVVTGVVDELLYTPIGGSEMADEHALMVLAPPFEHRGDECDAEAPTPVTTEVGQARTFVVLILGQVGVRELRYRYEHERIAEALISASESKMKVVGLRSETAIIEH